MRLRFDKELIHTCSEGEICKLCGNKKLDDAHGITCPQLRGYLIKRHDMIVRYLIQHISARKHPDTTSSAKHNGKDGMKPDILFEFENK